MPTRWRAVRRFISSGLLSLVIIASQINYAQEAPANTASIHTGTAEDWSSLSLRGSALRPEKPVLGQKDDYSLFSREMIRVEWRPGDPVDLYVILPKAVSKPPVILYLYSYPSETDRFRDNDYCLRLTRDGFAAVGFVSALTGHRYANRPMKEWFVSELQESLVTSVHDIQMILNFLSSRDDLDLTRVAMFGTGSGGTIAILAAATDTRIKAIDLLDPWGDWPDWMAKSSIVPDGERPQYMKPEFLNKIGWLDPVAWLPQLKTQVRLQQILDDDETPKEAKARIASAVPATSKVVKYENNEEFFRAGSGGRVFQWAKDVLSTPSRVDPIATSAQTSQPGKGIVKPGHDE